MLQSGHIAAGSVPTVRPVCHVARHAHLTIQFQSFQEEKMVMMVMMIPVNKCALQMQCAHNDDIIQKHCSTGGTLRSLEWQLTEVRQWRWQFLVSCRIQRYIM